MSTFDQLVVKEESDIRDYHFMVEWFRNVGTDYYNFEAEDGLDTNEKWNEMSDIIRGLGYSRAKFSATKCKDRFFQWSAFYAKNYDNLSGKLEPKVKEIFDLLKVIHILDFSKVWSPTNRTHLRLIEISKRPEIKEYLRDYHKKMSHLDANKAKIAKNSFPSDKEVVQTFEEMNLSDDLLRGIHSLYDDKGRPSMPSHIQKRAIVPCILGKDVIAQAQSGTGKTGAFAISILQRIDTSLKECQALILVPTRELAQQIHEEVFELGKFMNVRCHKSIGGTSVSGDANALKEGFHIVVGTPGRVLDMIRRKALCTDFIEIFVLDEADQLLDLNGRFVSKKQTKAFKNQIFDVFETLKPNIQVFLSSATMPEEILKMSHSFMKNQRIPILVKNEELTLEGLQQFFVTADNNQNKFDIFLDLYERIIKNKAFESSKIQTFVYLNTKRGVDCLIGMLESRGITLAHMYGHMDQKERDWILNDFRKGFSRVLITTDLLGRGIDVKEVELVINYDLPEIQETYMHRVGRSGRFGRTGKVISFVNPTEETKLGEIAKFYHTEIKELHDDFFKLFK